MTDFPLDSEDLDLEDFESRDLEGSNLDLQNYAVLLLNADYRPLRLLSWQRAIMLVWTNKVYVVETSGFKVRSAREEIPLPSVLVMRKHCKIPQKLPLSRYGLWIRDSYTCQYCGDTLKRYGGKLTSHDLTLDHVHPKSRGGDRSWLNLVVSCISCNQRKGNRTPKEAKMDLLTYPVIPKTSDVVLLMISQRENIPDAWRPYLGGSNNEL